MPFTDAQLNLDTGQFWQADFPRPVYEVVLERESIAIYKDARGKRRSIACYL